MARADRGGRCAPQRCVLSRIPDGLVTALRAIANRLREAPGNATARAEVWATENPHLSGADRTVGKTAYAEGWVSAECRRAADEITATLDAWQAMPPHARRRR